MLKTALDRRNLTSDRLFEETLEPKQNKDFGGQTTTDARIAETIQQLADGQISADEILFELSADSHHL